MYTEVRAKQQGDYFTLPSEEERRKAGEHSKYYLLPVTWVQTVGGTVRTAWSARGDTGTKAGPNGGGGGFTRRIDHRIGPLHRETAWLGVGLRAD